MHSSDGELVNSLIAQIRRVKKLQIEKSAFAGIELAGHLKVKVRVIDEDETELAFGDDLAQLKRDLVVAEFTPAASSPVASYQHELEAQGLRDWSFAELPGKIEAGEKLVLIRYPALVDKIDSVDLVLLADQTEAQVVTRKGVLRLCMFRSVQQRNSIQKQFARLVNLNALKWSQQLNGIAEAAVQESYIAAFELNAALPRTKSDFESLLEQGKPRILSAADKIEKLLTQIIEMHFRVSRQLQKHTNSSLTYLLDDIDRQLQNLVFEGFLSSTGLVWLQEYPRYFEAINFRLEKMPHMGAKDRSHTEQMVRYWDKYEALACNGPQSSHAEIRMLRWMLEEFRVSLFAQGLGTRMPVSAKKIDLHIDKLLS